MSEDSAWRDIYGGAIFMALGLGAAVVGQTYDIGSLTHMGAGFFPVLLGGCMALLGAYLCFEGWASRDIPANVAADEIGKAVPPHDWRGTTAIFLGIVAFIVIGSAFGLAPAAFACVFIAAIGDRSTTLKSAAILAFTATVLAVGFFSFVLHVQFPVFRLPIFGSGP